MSCPLPLLYNGSITTDAEGVPCDHLTQPFYRASDPIRRMERASIRWWIEQQRKYLRGRVLDFGAGTPATCYQPQPYRDLVQGEYVPHDLGEVVPAGPFDAVLCTQVLQYLQMPQANLYAIAQTRLRPGGYLVMTYPVSWPEVESTDLWRFTKSGIEWMLGTLGFEILVHDLRAEVVLVSEVNFGFQIGYGVVARNAK